MEVITEDEVEWRLKRQTMHNAKPCKQLVSVQVLWRETGRMYVGRMFAKYFGKGCRTRGEWLGGCGEACK